MNEILIYEDIGEAFFGDGVTGKSIQQQLAKMSGDLTVRVNSAGGDVFEGFAIYNLLKQYDGNVTVKVDALAASAASVIAMAGNDIQIAENALMMIHDPYAMAVGGAGEMRDLADLLDKIKDSIITAYQNKTEFEAEKLAEMMSVETWLNASEAVEMGFATGTIESMSNVQASINRPWITTEPDPEKFAENKSAHEFWRLANNRRRLSLID